MRGFISFKRLKLSQALSAFCVALVGMVMATSVYAQSVAVSQISGVVKDSTGAVVAGATVQVTKTDTGLVKSAVTDPSGAFLFPDLQIGPYEVKVTANGFAPYIQSGIILEVNSSPQVNPVLQVGSVTTEDWPDGT